MALATEGQPASAESTPARREVIGLSAVDGVLLLTLDTSASFEALRQGVRDTFAATPDRFRGRDARLDFGTRQLDLFDLRRLVHVLKDEFGVTATGIYCAQEAIVRYAERELKLRIYPHRAPEPEPAPPVEENLDVDVPEEAPEPEIAVAEVVAELEDEVEDAFEEAGRTLTLETGLRSGQVVHYKHDVLVFGDVNPGAEIVAGGNVLVLGALRGQVHAGANGDDNAIILAHDLRPTQLRLGRHIRFLPDEPARAVSFSPQIAWVRGEDIVIEPYMGKLPN